MLFRSGSVKYTGAVPAVQLPYEGGDYTVSFWLFVSGNTFINGQYRKHIFDIGGTNFSTVAIGIDANKTSLIVRTHSGMGPVAGAGGNGGGNGAGGNGGGSSEYNYDGGQYYYGGSFPGSDASRGAGSADCGLYGNCPGGSGGSNGSMQGFRNKEGFNTNSTPDCAQTTTLFAADMATLFDAPVITSSADCHPSPQCDIIEFNLQRWNLVTVVLSSKTTDVYIDGKLTRSCISSSYYKVDAVNVTPNILQHQAFEGKIANLNLYSVALNPAQIYQLYSAGPNL